MSSVAIFTNVRFFLFLLGAILLGIIAFDSLHEMYKNWSKEEYSHGYLIPLVAMFLIWQKRDALAASATPSPILGLLVLGGSLFSLYVGELAGIYVIKMYAYLIGVWGLALIWVGLGGVKAIWAGLFYLCFMIPLPPFFYNTLSQELQLISSALGVAVIRWFDISVFLEGNVIDLGVYQLQVVEACSGLRYLFPLISFGFLIAYIYKGPFWQRVVIFLSTVPITVLMNSFRIGLIGVTVEHFGIAAAEGILHDFEGWIVFMGCIAVLLFEIWIFYMFSKRQAAFSSLFDLDFGAGESVAPKQNRDIRNQLSAPSWLALVLLVAAIPFFHQLADRESFVPERVGYNEFPLRVNQWVGLEKSLDDDVLRILKLTDYYVANYKHPDHKYAVNFYSAWYAEQKKGERIHSPKTCLPGGGWEMEVFEETEIEEITAFGRPLKVNRVEMRMGEVQQLVYYWFQGRGRIITNEYLAKWYIFWDSVTQNRTDGGLMRLVTFVPEGTDIADADARLVEFLKDSFDTFPNHVPN